MDWVRILSSKKKTTELRKRRKLDKRLLHCSTESKVSNIYVWVKIISFRWLKCGQNNIIRDTIAE